MTGRPTARVALGAAAALLAGCSLTRPNGTPAPTIPARYPNGATYQSPAPAGTLTQAAAEIGWQDFFTDPALKRLLGLALRQNRDLRTAVLDVAQAQAQFRVQRAAQFPSLGASGSAVYEGLSNDGIGSGSVTTSTAVGGGSSVGASSAGGSAGSAAFGSPGSTHREYSASAGFTAYEVDLFGRLRALSHQAFEKYLAQRENQRAVALTVIGNVATSYITWRSDQALLDVTNDTLRTQEESAKLTRAEFAQGATTLLTLRQADTAVASARANQAQYARQVAQDINELSLLIAAPMPADLSPPAPLGQQTLMADLPAGLPADLLTRRPDILKAEHTLRADTADIGAARAAFFPQVTLTASGGLSSLQFNKLFTPGALTWSFAPQVSIPIFTFGQNRANLDVAKTQRAIDVEAYQKTIETAFHDVANALAARATYVDQVAAQQADVDAAADYNRLALMRFHAGVDTYLTALDAERTLYAAQQSLLTARAAQLENLVALYQDLGGGWR
jgi:multidrug efflux system outer membrane protein